MMEESFAEWGKVIAIGTSSQLPLPSPLLKVFVTTANQSLTHSLETARSIVQGLSLIPLPSAQRPAKPFCESTIAVNYFHPRIIEPSIRADDETKHPKPVVPLLIMTAVSTFTAWYIYRLTGQKLELQAQVKNYSERLQHEVNSKAALTSSKIKIFTLQGVKDEAVSAKIFWDTENNTCLVYLNHLPQTTPDQFFQLWFYTKDESFIKSRDFQTDRGMAELNIQIPAHDGKELDRMLVSVENTREYEFPTGKILAKGMIR